MTEIVEGAEPTPVTSGAKLAGANLRKRSRLLDVGAIILGLCMVLLGTIGLSTAANDGTGLVIAAVCLPAGFLTMPFTIAWLRRRGFPDNAFLHVGMVVGAIIIGGLLTSPLIPPSPPQAAATRPPTATLASKPDIPTASPTGPSARPASVIRDAMVVEARAQIARRDYAMALRTLRQGAATRGSENDPEVQALVDQANAGLSRRPGNSPAGAGELSQRAVAQTGRPAATVPVPAPARWGYDATPDAMRGTVTRRAWVASEDHPQFEFPYAGGSTLTLILQNRGGRDDIVLSVDKGQFLCSPYRGQVSVKFDRGPVQKFGCLQPSDGRSNAIFIVPARRFISQLRGAGRVTVEAEFFQAGRRQVTFQTNGLRW